MASWLLPCTGTEAIAVTPTDPGSAMLRQDLWVNLAPTLT